MGCRRSRDDAANARCRFGEGKEKAPTHGAGPDAQSSCLTHPGARSTRSVKQGRW